MSRLVVLHEGWRPDGKVEPFYIDPMEIIYIKGQENELYSGSIIKIKGTEEPLIVTEKPERILELMEQRVIRELSE